jgi:hypothetical protein
MKTSNNPMLKLKGTTPGGKATIRQHQALAQGYQMEEPENVVTTHQKYKGTGCTNAVGLTKKR